MLAKNEPPFLFSSGQARDPAFVNLRNPQSELAAAARAFVDELWHDYYPFADENFVVEIRNNFHCRFWEMYLTCAIREYFSGDWCVSSKKPGPDVLIEKDGRRIWIEAVAATDGKPSSLDSPSESKSHSGSIPEEKIILRLTTAVDEKLRKQIEYIETGVVAAGDAFIVAVNSGPVSYGWAEPEIPRILKAVFPIGNPQIYFDRRTLEVTGSGHSFRPSIRKANQSAVDTDGFLGVELRGVSGILYSHAHAAFPSRPLGRDFVLVHNPKAVCPLPTGMMPCAREYHARLTDEHLEIESLAGTLGTL